MYFVIPSPATNTKANMIIVEITKLTAPLVTTDTGKISLGKYTFLMMSPFPMMVKAD